MQRFNRLFDPIKVGSVSIRNRIVSTAMISNLANGDHLPNERHAYYYAEKAKGGVGLIVIESQAIHPTAGASAFAMAGYDPAVVPGYRRITEMVHAHGARIFCQLNHGGREHSSLHSERELWAPSPIAGPYHREVPHEMTSAEIAELLDYYALVAGHAEAGGFDGVEVHAGHGYLLQQFMSPLTNRRTDRYGGSAENRIRLTVEAIERVRGVIGDRLALGVRVSSNEFTPGGLATEDMIPIARRLVDTGMLDYLSVSQSNYHSIETLMPDMSFSHAHFVPFTARIKAAVPVVPVIAVGRIVRPEEAEKILADGQADLTAMTRALLSDPELPNKAYSGDVEGIRHCTGNNQGCVGRMFNGASLSCTHNPTIGYEREYGFESLAPRGDRPGRHLAVVGAGPAGLEAARVAASLGHRVTLLEGSDDIGGQLRLVACMPRRAEWGELVRYFRVQLDRLGVEVHLNTTATPTLLSEISPDAIVLAAGSAPATPDLPSDGSVRVLSDWEVFDLDVPASSHVVVLAAEDHYESPSIAEYLADDRSHRVDLVTSAPTVARAVDLAGLPPLLQRLDEKEVRSRASSVVGRVEGGAVFLETSRGRAADRLDDVAAIVVCGLRHARTELYQELLASEIPVEAVGDARAPRRVNEAIREGHWAGRAAHSAPAVRV